MTTQMSQTTRMPPSKPHTNGSSGYAGTRISGWSAFAGVMIALGGFFNLMDGLVALLRPHYYVSVSGNYALLVTADLHTWGWVAIGIASVMLLTGAVVLFTRALWARIVGVGVAVVNAVFQLAFLAHYPLWSLTIIIVDVLVIYGLVVPLSKTEEA